MAGCGDGEYEDLEMQASSTGESALLIGDRTGPRRQAASSVDASVPQAEVDTDVPLTLVLLGCVGVGKSSTANTVVGPDAPFKAKRSAASVTRSCQSYETTVGDAQVLVVDTPGLGDTSVDDADTYMAVRKGLRELVPASAPVCLLFVFSLQARVADAEMQMLNFYERKVFGATMWPSAMVVWTHADVLGDGLSLGEYLEDAGADVKAALARAGGGQLLFTNQAVDQPAPHGPQVLDLVSRARSIAGRLPQAKVYTPGISGRKAARRQRQLDNGLISQGRLRPPPKPKKEGEESSCVVL